MSSLPFTAPQHDQHEDGWPAAREFLIAEARATLAAWDAKNGRDIYGTERTLADQLRNVLNLLDSSANCEQRQD